MLSTCIWIVPIDIDLDQRGRVIFKVTSEVTEVLMQFLAIELQCNCISKHLNCGAAAHIER